MAQDTEDVTVKTPSGETIRATIRSGMSDADVYKMLSQKAPELMAPPAKGEMPVSRWLGGQGQNPASREAPLQPFSRENIEQANDPLARGRDALIGGSVGLAGGPASFGSRIAAGSPVNATRAEVMAQMVRAKLAQAAAQNPTLAKGAGIAGGGAVARAGWTGYDAIKDKVKQLLDMK